MDVNVAMASLYIYNDILIIVKALKQIGITWPMYVPHRIKTLKLLTSLYKTN